MPSLTTTASKMLGGVTAVASTNKTVRFSVLGTWVEDERYNVLLVNPETGTAISLGNGPITGLEASFLFTFASKMNFLSNNVWYFSAIDLPTEFNNPNGVGNGKINLADKYGSFVDTKAITVFQGKLALFGGNSIQIWSVDADPNNYQLVQVLANIGTIAKKSVMPFGELDAFFLHTTGIRSLRVRDASSNALTIDVGSQIDSLVKAKLASCSATEKAAACGVIDPNNSQYWLYIKDTLYVLSIFPSAKISAWSTWDCTYQATAGLGVKVVNSYGADFMVATGLTTDPSSKSPLVSVANGATSAQLPAGEYLFIYTSDGATLIATQSIEGGLSFSGVITTDTNFYNPVAYQTEFVPQDFVNYNGQVFISTSEGFYVYGGANNVTYDNTICASETSWLDFDSPAVQKTFAGVDVAQEGDWNHYASPDYLSQNFQGIMTAQANPTFAGGKIGWTNTGTHVKFRSQTYGTAERSVLSNILIHYKGNQSSK